MKTLVIGHGKAYKKSDIRCSPIPVDDWFHESFDSLDAYPEAEPDILFEIKTGVWAFADNESYDRIVDCTGGILSQGIMIRRSYPYILREVKRVLKPNGIFYTDVRTPKKYQKQGDILKEVLK